MQWALQLFALAAGRTTPASRLKMSSPSTSPSSCVDKPPPSELPFLHQLNDEKEVSRPQAGGMFAIAATMTFIISANLLLTEIPGDME